MSRKWESREERAARLRIEPEAIGRHWLDWEGRREPYGAREDEIEQSKAISLKRIADVLDGLTDSSADGRVLYIRALD